jgi:serine O-acetyltransferase
MTTFKYILSDFYRYSGKHGISDFLKTLLTIEGAKFSIVFRIGSSLSKKNPFYWFFYLINNILGKWYGYQIPLKTSIGNGLYIGHTGTLIINGGSIIGNNCNFGPGVTIGQVSEGKNKGCPVLEDNVWIGTNAVCVGNIKIGKNSHICPNSFVNFSVPSNSLVIGNPAIIKDGWNKTDSYIINKWVE